MSKEPRWMRIKLKEAVFKNSLEKQDITKAAPEWIISHHYTRQGSTCVCGQHPITECSIIKNIYTGKMLDPIGNECIHYFQDQNLDYQLKTWQTQDKKIRGGPYAGMSFDIVADQLPPGLETICDATGLHDLPQHALTQLGHSHCHDPPTHHGTCYAHPATET